MHLFGHKRKIGRCRRISNPKARFRHIPIAKDTVSECSRCRLDACEGGTNMKGFFNQDGFEIVIWILVIIFLLSIFFDEGID